MNSLSNSIALFIITTIPIPFAAVQPWVWSFYALIIIIHYILTAWTLPVSLRQPGAPAWTKLVVVFFFIWTLVLCLPLPPAALSVVTPVRSAILASTWELTGSPSSWQAISYLPRNAFGWWVFLLSLFLFYHATCRLCENEKTLKRIVFVMIAIGMAEALYGLVQALIPSMGVLWVDYVQAYLGSARGTFINRNNFAGFIEMIWPLALGLTLSMAGQVHSIKMVLHSERLNRQALMALCIIVFLLVLILTRSRAGIVCGSVGFFVFFTLARPSMQKRSKQFQVMLGGIVVLLIAYTMIIGVGPVIDRFFTIGGDGSSRINIWRDSVAIVRDHPLGIGLRNYENVMGIYNHMGRGDKIIVYAHNDYLQLLIETGWIGFLTLGAVGIVFLIRAVRSIRQLDFRKDPLRFYLAVGAFSGIVSIGTHSLFDFNLQIPANCVYFVALMAILRTCTTPGQSQGTQNIA